MNKESSYDYVIVGAGSSGCVLANRLSADPSCRVLLLEAGGKDDKMEVRIPAAFTKLFKTAHDWAFATDPQEKLAGRALFWPRGKMLGGSSSMNAQMWIRGNRADYDAWEASGNSGWGWDSVARAFNKAECCATGAREVYGEAGPCFVEDQRDVNPTTLAFLEACAKMGWRRQDLNEADNEGFGVTRVTQRRGRRWSTADAYLRPALKRPNLTVETHATVHRVWMAGKCARGVEYSEQDGGFRKVEARREVILSAGSIGSPQLLMLSGIGSSEELRAFGIDVVANSPEVGRNLQDHLVTAIIYRCSSPVTLVSAESPLNLLKYLLLRKGMLTSCVGEAAAFIRTRPDLPAPDIELIWAPVPFIDHGLVTPPGHGVTMGVVLLQPESRGTIRLRSADPQAAPAIDPGYLTDPSGRDLATIVAGIRIARELFEKPSLAPLAEIPYEPGPDVDSDEALAAFVREQAETLYHPVGTCRMGSDDRAVVDPHLRVRGVDNLRVVDASVMPRINRGHTNAPTIMIAERAAEMILAARASG